MSNKWQTRILVCSVLFLSFPLLQAQTILWAGHTWNVTNGGMAGVALGDPHNVNIDDRGYLHLRILNRKGKWTASELFTTDNMGFGTYQWIVQGDVYEMDPTTVLGLFTYGPDHNIGVDGENEIDVEFSQWNKTCGGCDADFTVYPSTGNRKRSGAPSWEDDFYTKGVQLTTARMEWWSDHIVFTIMKGNRPIGTRDDVIKTESYSSNTTNIPQESSPVGINLWCFENTPAENQSVIIRDFQFVPH